MTRLLELILSLMGRSASESELVKIGFRAASVVPGLLDGDAHLSADQLATLSDIILDVRAGRL